MLQVLKGEGLQQQANFVHGAPVLNLRACFLLLRVLRVLRVFEGFECFEGFEGFEGLQGFEASGFWLGASGVQSVEVEFAVQKANLCTTPRT